MMTASNIKYEVDEVNKVITATVSDCKHDVLNLLLKAFRRQNLFLSNTFINNIEAVYDPEKDTGEDDPENPCLTIDTTECDLTTCHKFLLKDTYTATATYDPSDPNPFSIERGKQIARRRLYNAYNKDYRKALDNIMSALDNAINDTLMPAYDLTKEREINFGYFEFYDVFKAHLDKI